MKIKSYYSIPDPIVNKKEKQTLDVLTERYEKLCKPGLVGTAEAQIGKIGKSVGKIGKSVGTQVGKIVPEPVKKAGEKVGEKVTETVSAKALYEQAMKIVEDGFINVQKYAANATINDTAIIEQANKIIPDNEIIDIDEICLARSYNISRLVSKFKKRDFFVAFGEGAATGAFGFAGIPFNLVLSTFLYFRAVQTIALYYGYDVKNDPSELIIASDVFMNALSPASQSADGVSGTIGKIMMFTETTAIKQTAKKTWSDMAAHGGVGLVITQMRALANSSARKALEKAGEKGLEESIFKNVFEQVGKGLTLKFVERSAPVFGAIVGAFFDSSQMNTILEYADVFYNKRFLLEKEVRISYLLEENSEVVYESD